MIFIHNVSSMGGKESKNIEPRTLHELRNQVEFTDDEIQNWFQEYNSSLAKGQKELTREEFKNVYNSIFIGDATEFAEHVFRTFDHDRSGTVNFKEFLVGLHVSGSSNLDTKLRWAFKMYDINGNGMIDKDEMKTIVSAIFKMTAAKVPEELNTPEKMTEKFFKELDVDQDGEISWDEFERGANKDPIILSLLQCDPDA
ncbi:HPCL1-like protein [Mya arenaria]|uniref:HPCL1-like protein n=1 Tax=Mya arenaria TaxID=6604 RepID=A0ABY7FLB0_MYAAR|nr:hippocalcin-like protein 1 [Mya arenaria]WAR22998.1 HPCL1-like protein [Mya arenaria]